MSDETHTTNRCLSCKRSPCECVTNTEANAQLANESYNEKFNRMKRRKDERNN